MVLTSIFMFSYNYSKPLSDIEIEERARSFGMHYTDECKVLFGEEGLNND